MRLWELTQWHALAAGLLFVVLHPTARRVVFEPKIPDPRHPAIASSDHAVIPRRIHQFWTGPNRPEALMDRCKKMHAAWEYTLWTPETVPELKNHRIMAQFQADRVYDGQSDVLRYELLWKHGGVWLDADVVCLRPLDDLLDNRTGFITAFQNYGNPDAAEGQWYHPRQFLLQTSVMAASRGHPMLGAIVDTLRNNRHKAYGVPWITVGPAHVTKTVHSFPQFMLNARILPYTAFTPYHHAETHIFKAANYMTLPRVAENKSYTMNLWGTTFTSYVNLVKA